MLTQLDKYLTAFTQEEFDMNRTVPVLQARRKMSTLNIGT